MNNIRYNIYIFREILNTIFLIIYFLAIFIMVYPELKRQYKVLYIDIFGEQEVENFIEGKRKVEIIEKCPICLTEDSNVVTSCKHQGCKDCFKTIHNMNWKIDCPMCRKENVRLYEIDPS